MTHHEQKLPVKGKREAVAMALVNTVVLANHGDRKVARVERGFQKIFDYFKADISLCEPEIMAIEDAVFAEVTG